MTSPASPTADRRILIARFDREGGAEGALGRLKSAGVRLGNVAKVTRKASGEVDFSETQDWGIGKSAAVGAVAGLILPGIGTLAGAAVAGLAAYFVDLGFPDELLKQAGSGLLQPGQSAIVALVQAEDTAHAEAQVTAEGGQVLASGAEADLARVLDQVRGTA
jgi:uncharacterized membrane protein